MYVGGLVDCWMPGSCYSADACKIYGFGFKTVFGKKYYLNDSEDLKGENATRICTFKIKMPIYNFLPIDGRQIYYKGIIKLCTIFFYLHLRTDCKNQQDRVTTFFKTCRTGSLFWGVGSGCKVVNRENGVLEKKTERFPKKKICVLKKEICVFGKNSPGSLMAVP